jgi:histidyl-tRNA synthetase
MSKPSLPKGTRDFGPLEMQRRNYLFGVIRGHFERYGFSQIETPAMENLATLTGKYGDEGDQLIFKILSNGDFLAKADEKALALRDSKKLGFSISSKALRYDLTVPFARFVVMNSGKLPLPFRRYQIQPVWRGDRPGKGRYQEFFQCDADIIGTEGLLSEVELVLLFEDVLSELRIPGVRIKMNNRKILAGIAESLHLGDRLRPLTIALDKLDKIGREGVEKELIERGFSAGEVASLHPLFSLEGTAEQKLEGISALLTSSEIGMKGIEELSYVFSMAEKACISHCTLEFDLTLARGLDYYTGAIFEVTVEGAEVGSICGGGRYDDLTGIFGLPGVSGVGISFGADRISDVMEQFNLFPLEFEGATRVLFANFGQAGEAYCLKWLRKLRINKIPSELYPESAKMKKQFKYADDKSIPYVIVVGEEELHKGELAVKNMKTGEQVLVKENDFLNYIESL